MTRARSMIARGKFGFLPSISFIFFYTPLPFWQQPEKRETISTRPSPPRWKSGIPCIFPSHIFFLLDGGRSSRRSCSCSSFVCQGYIMPPPLWKDKPRHVSPPPSFHIQTPPPPPLPATTQQNPRAVGKTLHFLCSEPPKPCVGKSTAEC